MDSKYEVIVTERAKQELNELLKLETVPEGFSVIENYIRKDFKYRRLPINNYVAIYRIDKKERKVYIVRIIYGGRNYLNEL